MNNIFEIPKLNPLKIFEQKEDFNLFGTTILNGNNPNFNTTSFDSTFFVDLLKSWDDEVKFYQPFQTGDSIRLHWFGVVVGGAPPPYDEPYNVVIYDCKGVEYFSKRATVSTVINSQQLFTIDIPLFDFAEGRYILQISYNSNVNGWDKCVISEPFEIKETWNDTILINYKNSYNTQSILFEQSGVEFQIRIPAIITDLMPVLKSEVYQDQPLNQTLLSGVPFREWTLKIGGDGIRVTDWLIDKINRILGCDYTKFDNDFYTINEGANLEPARVDFSGLASWSISLRERYNYDSVEMKNYGVYSYGALPQSKYFYVHQIASPITVSYVDVEKYFSSVKSFIAYLNAELLVPMSLEGVFVLNKENELVYQCANITEGTAFVSFPPDVKILSCWIKLKIDTSGAPDLNVNLNPIGSVSSADFGDGSTQVATSGALMTHTYVGGGVVECIFFVKDCTDLMVATSSQSILYLDGEFDDIVETFVCSGESIAEIGSKFFNYSKPISLFDVSSNKINRINTFIIDLKNNLTKGNLLPSCNVNLASQTPPSYPSDSQSMIDLIVDINNEIILTTD